MADDYRIYSRPDTVGGKPRLVVSNRQGSTLDAKGAGELLKASFSVNGDALSVKISPEAFSGKPAASAKEMSLSLGNATSSLNILSSALKDITSLLEEKQTLEGQLSEGLQNSETEALTERIAQIDSRVSQITSSTSFNDQNLLNGFTAGQYNIGAVIVQAGGSTGDDLESIASSILQVDQALQGIEASLQDASIERSQNATGITQESVSSLVQKIAGEITSPFNSLTTKISLIESASSALRPDRVTQLLS